MKYPNIPNLQHQPVSPSLGSTPVSTLGQGPAYAQGPANAQGQANAKRAFSPYAPYGHSSSFAAPIRKRVRIRGVAGIFIIGFSLLFFGGSYLLAPENDVEIIPVMGTASIDGRDVALVPYHYTGGRGMFQLMTGGMFQVRLAARYLDNGDRAWDVKLNGDLVGAAGVLAAGATYVYVASDYGLTILNLADGSVAVKPAEIPGIGANYVATYDAYNYDVASSTIVAMDSAGAIWSIPLDSAEAVPADAALARKWTGTLSADTTAWMYYDYGFDANATDAFMPDGSRLILAPPSAGSPAQHLTLHLTSGDTAAWTADFFDASLILEAQRIAPPNATAQDRAQENTDTDGTVITTTPAGASQGFALVQHHPTVNATDTFQLSVINLAGGEVLATTNMASEASRAMLTPSGLTLISATEGESFGANELITVGSDGSLRHIPIGATNFFGLRT